MNSKQLKQGLMVLALGLSWYGTAQAVAPNPDSMVVSVTPGGLTYGVVITSPMAQGYVFGTVNLGQTTISTVGITVQNGGNVAEYFTMKVSSTSSDNWGPVSSVTPGTDRFRLMAYMTSGTQPTDGTFADSLGLTLPGAGSGLYGQGGRTTPSLTQTLWLRLTMPSGVSAGTANAQTMVVSINGQAS